MGTCVPTTQVTKNHMTITSEVPRIIFQNPIPFPLPSKANTMLNFVYNFLAFLNRFPTYVIICKQYIV